MHTCIYCHTSLDDTVDDLFNSSHDSINCDSCGKWQRCDDDITNSEYWESNNKYHDRQGEVGDVSANMDLFANVLRDIDRESSILELGAGEGRNIKALHNIGFNHLTSIEINAEAAKKIPHGAVIGGVPLDHVNGVIKSDIILTKGFLIHIPPIEVNRVYDFMYNSSIKYILMCEYFSPNREMIKYRGEDNRLWRANFYEEIILRYPDLKLVEYGFVGKWNEAPQDNLTWWLLRKQ